MTLSGGGGILSLIVPVLKLLEVNSLSSFLNMVIESYLQICRLIRENLRVLWYREAFDLSDFVHIMIMTLSGGGGYYIHYSTRTKIIRRIYF